MNRLQITLIFSAMILNTSYVAQAQTDWTPSTKQGIITMTGVSGATYDIDVSRSQAHTGFRIFNTSTIGRSLILLGQGYGGKYGYLVHHNESHVSDAGYTQTYKPSSTVLTGSDVNGLGLASAADIRFNAGGVDDTKERMVIKSDGSIGIGFQSPLAKLQVNGSIYSSSRTDNTFNGNLAAHSANFIGASGYWAIRTSTNNAFNLDVFNGNSPIVALTTLQNGKVGIGTTTPSYQLEVKSTSASNLRLVSNGSTSHNPTIDLFDNVNGTEFVLSPSAGKVDLFTYSNHALAFGTVNNEKMRINPNGNVGIGTTNPSQKLEVKGTVYSTEVKVDVNAGTGPDYVFEPAYNLPTLAETEAFIKANKHLPEVPSAKEMEANGINLSEMNMLLLKKVEELTLHLIEATKKIESQQKHIDALDKKVYGKK